jgi:25S rRNA (uracil2634-N3)-methyltransferase
MPRLKFALQSHQAAAHQSELAKKRYQNDADKAKSVKASASGLKKAQKKARLAARFSKSDAASDPTIEGGEGVNISIGTGVTPTPEIRQDKGKAKAIIPFSPDDTILLLGEANFSFALSLVDHHHHPAHQILATSYDSERVCFEKYPDGREYVRQLLERGVVVEFGVDGGALEKCKKVGKGRWSRVIMNFPHTGK